MIEVCTAIHDKYGTYVKYVGTMMASVLANTHSPVRFHVLTDETFCSTSRKYLCETVESLGGTIIFYDICINDLLLSKESLQRFSIATMYRLKILDELPKQLDRLIYLDADILFNLDVLELWQTNLDGNFLAGCIDYFIPEQRKYVCRQGIVSSKEYINAGVLLFDLARIRKEKDLFKESQLFFSKFPQANYFDQDAINYIFKDNILLLDRKWNVSTVEQRRLRMAEQSVVYHFLADSPRDSQTYAPDRLFLKYLRLTPWGTNTELLLHYERRLRDKDERLKKVLKMQKIMQIYPDKRHVFWGGRRNPFNYYAVLSIEQRRLFCRQQCCTVGETFRGESYAFTRNSSFVTEENIDYCYNFSLCRGQKSVRSLGVSRRHRFLRRPNCVIRFTASHLFRASRERLGCIDLDSGKVLISIVVPIYNIDIYLPQCVESILAQSYQNIEVVLVDDGSSDNCPAICDTFALRDNRVKVIHKLNGGLVSARKEGVRVAKGEYILPLDGDDWLDVDYVKSMAAPLVESRPDMVANLSLCKSYDDGCNIERVAPFATRLYKADEILTELYSRFCREDMFWETDLSMNVCSYLYRREFVLPLQNNVDDTITIGEDTALSFSAFLKANAVAVVNRPGYHYRQRVGSMLHGGDEASFIAISHLYKHLCKVISNAGLSSRSRALQKKIPRLIYAALIMGDVGHMIAISKDYLFPYPSIKNGDTIFIYGLGVVGQGMLQAINRSKRFKLAGCTDQRWHSYGKEIAFDDGNVCQVYAPDSIKMIEFDWLLIAVSRAKVRKEIKNKIAMTGISMKKIAILDQSLLTEEKIPFEK